MNIPRFLKYLILLLAVWLPLNNAVAAAVIVDCPMMSHAFENGMRATIHPDAVSQVSLDAMSVSMHQPNMLATQPDNSGMHCGICVLLGGAALPSLNASFPLIAYPTAYDGAAQSQAPAGTPSHPFRPPIV